MALRGDAAGRVASGVFVRSFTLLDAAATALLVGVAGAALADVVGALTVALEVGAAAVGVSARASWFGMAGRSASRTARPAIRSRLAAPITAAAISSVCGERGLAGAACSGLLHVPSVAGTGPAAGAAADSTGNVGSACSAGLCPSTFSTRSTASELRAGPNGAIAAANAATC